MQGHLVFIDNGLFIQEANGKLTPFRFPVGGTCKTTINNIVSGGEWINAGTFTTSQFQAAPGGATLKRLVIIPSIPAGNVITDIMFKQGIIPFADVSPDLVLTFVDNSNNSGLIANAWSLIGESGNVLQGYSNQVYNNFNFNVNYPVKAQLFLAGGGNISTLTGTGLTFWYKTQPIPTDF